MTTLPDEDDLLRTFLALETPPGFRAQLINGEIVLSPPPDGAHVTALSLINRELLRRSSTEVLISGTKGLIVPGGRFVPDGTVCPEDWFRGKDPWADPAGLLMVFEVTSTDRHRNRGPKRRGYAAAGIPCYLLVDRGERKVILFTSPEGDDYTVHTQVAFGKPLDLPAPFSFTLDTGPLR
ncbi:Uma2 family endonuclease [Kitasatospora purpeofusca]|uniref:Uma2 family endonuclease n=1 Tax=Kitasatospora purpeofusca TaxID=67352 RepID=UPI0035D5DBCD